MRKTATNQFGDGLVTDFHPLTVKNTTLVDALNATLVTTKGNEMILQNDAGNIQIKTGDNSYVKLKDGFIPVGIKEYNGIIYIASYYPEKNLSELGSYPSFRSDRNYNILKIRGDYYRQRFSSGKLNTYLPLQNFYQKKPGEQIPNLVEEASDLSLYTGRAEIVESFGDFTTSKLNFDLSHPVNIEIQPSYDGSVNLILTDDKNPPRLINSGFAVTESGDIFIPNRNNNQENIYTEDDFDLQTSLIKRTNFFPKVTYKGVLNSGNLKVGNYTLYFKYADDDGNETDFIAWSNMISIFKGNDCDPFSIDGGVEDMNANKSIQIQLENLDEAYRYIRVYYSRTSSAIDSNRIPQAYSIDKNFPYEGDTCKVIITGEENITQIPISELNTQYFVANTAKTQAQCQNILFLGNSTTTDVSYTDLTNLSLYIQPRGTRTLSKNLIGEVSAKNYTDTSNLPSSEYKFEYYNTKNIYEHVGYWNEEYYRLGIVYILSDNTKTSVFNILGGEFKFTAFNEDTQQEEPVNECALYDEHNKAPNRKRVEFGCNIEEILKANNDYIAESDEQLNVRGVIHFNDQNETDSFVYGIKVIIPDEVVTKLQELGIKGYFIVRQKRIPTIMCQGYTLPWDKEAKIPIVTYQGFRDLARNFNINETLPETKQYFVESFLRQCSEETSSDWQDADETELCRQITNKYYPRLHYILKEAIDAKMVDGVSEDIPADGKYRYSGIDTFTYYFDDGTQYRKGSLQEIISHIQGGDTEESLTIYKEETESSITIPIKDGYSYSVFYQFIGIDGKFSTPSFVTDRIHSVLQLASAGVTVTKDDNTTVDEMFGASPMLMKKTNTADADQQITSGYVVENWTELTQDLYIKRVDGVTISSTNSKCDTISKYYLNRILSYGGMNSPQAIVSGNVIKHFYDLYKYCDGRQLTAICPEFEVRQPYYNSLFTGTEYTTKYTKLQYNYLTTKKERLYNVGTTVSEEEKPETFKIVSVTDTVPIVAIDNTIFKSTIGSEAEAYRFSYINEEHCANRRNESKDDHDNNSKNEHDFNLVRGIFSPYLGIVVTTPQSSNPNEQEDFQNYCKIFNVYYPENSKEFEVRFENNSAYYPITSSMQLLVGESPSNIYQGDCFLCTFTHRVNRNFNDPTTPTNDHILDPETWRKNYEPDTDSDNKGIEKLNQINRGDVNAVKLGSWITIKVKSSYNLSIRSLDESHLQEQGVMGRARGFYPLQQASADGGFKIPNSYVINDAFGATVGEQYYDAIIDAPYINTDFSNRIAYSDIDVTGAFKNGYRIFRGQHYRDYTKQYGAIIKLIELQSNLLCVFEHGVALIPINERALAAEGSGGEVYINNSNVLPETPKILSDMYGSQWAESVVKTPYYIYGIDAARKKIWKTNGVQFEIISDFRIEKFLVNNLTLSENDVLPYLAIKNIASHYNANKSDVIFTFYTRQFEWEELKDECGKTIGYNPILSTEIQDELAWSICYNEILQKFETFYSWIPIASANIDNEFYSFDRECSREILISQEQTNQGEKDQRKDETGYHQPIKVPYLWKHGRIENDRPKPTNWYGEQHPFEFEFVVNAEAGVQKIFDNLRIISNSAEPESFHFTIEGDNYEFSNDKPNMYYRQEATKELFQKLGSHISFNKNYEKLKNILKQNMRSTIFPLYYNRIDVFNDIYDHYTQMLDKAKSRDYKELSGSEITWDEDLNQFFITTHVKNNLIDKEGYLRGNSRYLEGQWQIQIPTITLMQKNEENYWDKDQNWTNGVPPIVINPSISADDLTEYTIDKTGLPNTYSMGDIRTTGWTFRKESNIRDKYCKIKIRYSGEKLAVISAVITTFTLSYA